MLATMAPARQGAILEEALASNDPTRHMTEAATNARQAAKREPQLTCQQVLARLAKAVAGLEQIRCLLDDPSLDVSEWANIGSSKNELTRIIKRLHQLLASPSRADDTQTAQLLLFPECRNEH